MARSAIRDAFKGGEGDEAIITAGPTGAPIREEIAAKIKETSGASGEEVMKVVDMALLNN